MAKVFVPVMRKVEQRKQGNSNSKIRVGFTHIRKIQMDINLIAQHMTDKIIDDVDIVDGASEMIITLSDGSSVEIVVDSIYMNVQDLDD